MPPFSAIATLGLLVTHSAGVPVHRRWDSASPFFETDPGAPSDCSLWWNTDDGLPCDVALNIAGAIEADLTGLPEPEPVPNPTQPSAPTATPTKPSNGIETTQPIQDDGQLHQWNKGIGGTACNNMWTGYNLCISVSGSPTTTEPVANPNPTPDPIQDGMVSNCNKFYLVASGDNCWNVARKYGVTESQLQQWNTGIGGFACNNMWTDYHLCVGVSGGGGSQTQPPPASNTPQPVQDGMVGNCKRFYFVQGGQNCDGISRSYGISVGDFVRWNPAAGSDCRGLWANTYACVGV
ncbi:LysM domain-containing protein [Magnaporthiopsis poae ATCC 64411]|uniref:LysM domain-containing protein n=1 Tax=Magnaporthiopsis poae (strain ATCC 64411 / 73-15) TaxID=644358 RepID=A0A0C4E931_MAGP6|nr:LysM domain-containing protein [Magnaporthiopsis poae ATCC 64411]